MATTPVVPVLVEPSVPTLLSIVIPAQLTLTQLVLPASIEDLNINVSNNTLAYSYPAYGYTIQALLDNRLESKLNYDVGLAESELRHNETVDEVKEVVISKTLDGLNTSAARGFMVPDGATQRVLQEINLLGQKTILVKRNEQFTKESDLHLEMVQFGFKIGLQTEAYVWDSHKRLKGATLQAAIAISKTLHENFAILVESYNDRLAGLQLKLDTWKSQQRSVLLELAAYRESLDVVVLDVEMRGILWDIYKAKVEYQTLIEQLQGFNFDAFLFEAERVRALTLKYKSEWDLYNARINSNTAEFKVYRAKIKAELVKLEKYQIQVDTAERVLRASISYTNAVEAKNMASIAKANIAVVELQNNLQLARDTLLLDISKAKNKLKRYDITMEVLRNSVGVWEQEATRTIESYAGRSTLTSRDSITEIDNATNVESDRIKVDSSVAATNRIADIHIEKLIASAEIAAKSDLTAEITQRIVAVGK